MSQKAETLLKSWKGAQAIVELHPIPRYVILTLMGAFGVFLSTAILSGNIIPVLFGLGFGGFFLYITILCFNVGISRDRELSRRKSEEEMIKLIRHTFKKEGKDITENSLREFITLFSSFLDTHSDESKKSGDSNEILQLKTNVREQDGIIKEKTESIEKLTLRINQLENSILPHIARQNRHDFDFDHRLKKIEQEKTEKLQTMNEKAHSTDIAENSAVDKDKKFEDDL